MPELALPLPEQDRLEPELPALGELARLHFAPVWRLLRRLGLPPADADDATQQVFLLACTKQSRIREGSERAFLFGCAINLAAKWRSLRQRAADQVGVEALESQLVDTPETDVLLDRYRARLLLDAVLAEMPMQLRTIFVLYELEQWSTYEVADVLKLPRGTVASRLRRARAFFEQRVRRLRERTQRGVGK